MELPPVIQTIRNWKQEDKAVITQKEEKSDEVQISTGSATPSLGALENCFTNAYTPLDLFQLYFSPTTVRTLCTNTNKRAAKSKEMGKKYKWADVEVEELYKFLGLLTYTSLVPLPTITDYWKQNTITSVLFPSYSDGEGPFQGSALEHPPQ
ncbi:hypothetical protein D5F01_LYC20733 [Larimichthys crocea]|uniref:PiggyBac transposable element-derived protein domain-containing protein n=1 Tax=Larimichthys crocea TaxID=215358 RepID=A0A6G0HRN9_LARCR|nr:hypothetical protein D5F01_LYC20733 [Larimichthys crocea]